MVANMAGPRSSTSSSWAPARPAARSPAGSRRRRRRGGRRSGAAGPATASRGRGRRGWEDVLGARVRGALYKPWRTRRDWNYATEPQPGLGGRELFWPRGKLLGGSSSINAMIYMRGAAADYDEWAGLTGDDAWSSTNVLALF